MSDQIRQTISAKKKQLQRQLTNVPNFPSDPKPPAGQSHAETIIDFQATESQIEDQVRRIRCSVAAIEEAQQSWSSLLHKMTEKERPAETTVYTTFMEGDGNPENTLDIATTTVEGLEDLLVKVRKVLAKAKLEEEKASETARTNAQTNALDLAKAQADIAKAATAWPVVPGQGLDADQLAKALATAMSGGGAVKLPKIQLPKFAGSRAEWPAFKRIFKATVEDRVTLHIKLTNGDYTALELFTTEQILSESAAVLVTDADLKKAATYAECIVGSRESPEILIGIDQEPVFDVKNIHGPKLLASGFSLKSTLLGPVLCGRGRLKYAKPVHTASIAIHQAIEDEPSEEQRVADYFQLENLAIAAEPEVDADELTRQFFKKTAKRVGDRCQVSLPWNDGVNELPTNHQLALKRYFRVFGGLDNPTKQASQAIIDEYREKSIIRRVANPNESQGPVHYLAIHIVKKEGPDGQVKVRLTLDAAAKMRDGRSLNECLERGPVLLNDLLGMILRFRTTSVAVLADVEKAFLQLLLDPSDRGVTRFLWPKKMDDPHGGYDVFEFERLPFGLRPSPYLLAASVDDYLEDVNTPLANELRRNIYVDNLLIRANDNEEARQKVEDAKRLFERIHMPLREFQSNCREAIADLGEKETLKSRISKILGTRWDIAEDELVFQLPQFHVDSDWTLRGLTRGVAKLFDPSGLLAPCLVPAKRVLQETWQWHGEQQKLRKTDSSDQEKLKWDRSLPEKLQSLWRSIAEDWQAGTFRINRRVTTLDPGTAKYHLHAFSDASMHVFGTAVYLLSIAGGTAEANLVLAKARVRPSQGKWTIPRLELAGVLLSARALKYVEKELDLPIESATMWTDASCVIDWIKSPDPVDKFVDNKRREIVANQTFFLRHVAGTSNPADMLSRGRTVNGLKDDIDLWLHGPKFLLNETLPGRAICMGDVAVKRLEKDTVETIIDVSANVLSDQPEDGVIDPDRFSNWRSMRRVTAYVLKYVHKKLLNKLPPGKKMPEFLTKLRSRETDRVLTVSEREFAGEYLLRQEQKRHPPPKDVAKNLDIYVDDKGLLRSRWRLGDSNLPEEAKFPIYLDQGSRVTELIVKDVHKSTHHCGPMTVLAELRKHYWVPCGKRTLKSILLKTCKNCKKLGLQSFRLPKEPPLPQERVVLEGVFANTGVDYAGPFTVKVEPDVAAKVYILLFTCMTTRNLYLEVVRDYTTESFILAFRRFVSRRGRPKKVYSDHGSQFELGSKVVEEAFKSRGFQAYLAEKGVTWRFVTEKSPWAGGFYEAMVKLVKSSIKRTIGRSVIKIDKFSTLVTEMEGFLNGRPLTYQSDDINYPRPLRPIDFMFPAGDSVEPASVEEDGETFKPTSRDTLLDKLAKDQKKLSEFKRVFYESYLPALRERKGKTQGKIAREPTVGEVVLVENDDSSRLTWDLGRVTELLRTRDGNVRSAKVLVRDRILRRPICALYPLEVDVEGDSPETITIRRKGKEKGPGPQDPPRRCHKMTLRDRKGSPSDPAATMPIIVFSAMTAPDDVLSLGEELDYSEEENEATDSNTSSRLPRADSGSQAGLTSVTMRGGRLGSPATRFIQHHLSTAVNHGKEALEKALALKKTQAQIEERVMNEKNAWPKWSRGGTSHPKPPQRNHSTDRRQGHARERATSKSPRRGQTQNRGRSGHRHSTPPETGRSRRSSRRTPGQRPRRTGSNRPETSTSRHRTPPKDSTRIEVEHATKRKPSEVPENEAKRKKTTEQDNESLTRLYSKTRTGLEPTLRVCQCGTAGHERCPRVSPILLDLNYFANYPQIANRDIESPYQLILIYLAIRQQKSKLSADFISELLRSGDMFPLVWSKWKSRFGKMQRVDAVRAANKWRESCLVAKDSIAKATAPFAWTGARTSEEEDNDLIQHWMSALNKMVAEVNGRENVDSTVMMVGDQWSVQIAASLESVYNKPKPLDETIKLVKEHFFFGGTRHLVVMAGKDCIMLDGDHRQHYELMTELVRAIPAHVSIALVEPPKIPDREEAWERHRQHLKKFLKREKERVQKISLPQLTGGEVAPAFIEECVGDDGLLKELGVWTVSQQIKHLLKLPLKLRDKAPKVNVKGYYSGENLRGPSLDERIRKGLATNTLFMSCLCLFLLCLPVLNATDPMTCLKDSSSLYDLSDYLSACTLPIGDDVEEHKKALKVFHNNTQIHGRTASQCFRKVEEISYGQVLGMRSSHPPKVRYKRVTPEECRVWVRDHKCEIGEGTEAKDEQLNADGDVFRTDRKAEVDYGSWYNPFSYGHGLAIAENCFVTPTPIAVSSLLDHIVSDAGDTRGCRYTAGQCQLPDKSALIWEPEQGLTCPFQKLGVWQGSYYYEAGMYVWTADHGQFVLTFSDSAHPVSAQCDEDRGSQYVVADSGLAISVATYDSLSRLRSKRSQKSKPDPSAGVEIVQNDILATQLSAVTKHCEKNDKRISKRLRDLICNVAKDVYTPSKIEATILARAILGTEFVQAEFPTTKPVMEVWRCTRLGTLNSSVAVTEVNGQCHKRPPVRIVTDNGEILQRFLDTRLMIATEDSELGPCETHRSHVTEINGKMWRMNQATGEHVEEPNIIKLIHGVNNSWTLPDLDTLEFHNWVLLKQEAPLSREEARTRGRKALETVQKTSMRVEDSHNAPSRVHLPSWDELIFGWVPMPPRLLVTLCVWAMALKLAWIIFLNLAWPYIGVKLLSSLLPETHQHLVPRKIDQDQRLQDQLREQQQRYTDLIKEMERQMDLLRSATNTTRPSMSHVDETTLSHDENSAPRNEQPRPSSTAAIEGMNRGTKTRRTINRKAHFERLNFLKAGVSGPDEEE